MGFFDLVNIRAINGKLNELMPVVEANLSRLSTYYSTNFKVTKRSKGGLSILDETEDVVVTTQQHIDEFLRLKREFESEFQSVQAIVEKIKPITFLDDDRSYVHWHNKLVSISWAYDALLKLINARKMYLKS